MNETTFNYSIFVSNFGAYSAGLLPGEWLSLREYASPLALWHAVRRANGGSFGQEYMLQCSQNFSFEIPEYFTPRLACILWAIANYEDPELLDAYLACEGLDAAEKPADIIDAAENALAGRLDDVCWTQYPDFSDWAFSRFLEEHPKAKEFENFLDSDAIARNASVYYQQNAGYVFAR